MADLLKALFVIACVFLTACRQSPSAATKPEASPAAKPKITEDGFPAGHDSPEGAACDLARAFIKRDPALFASTCLRSYGPEDYAKFLKETAESIRQEAAKTEPSPDGPREIGKVFAARHLNKDGPVSYGYASFGFQDVMFVDVGVFLHDGRRSLVRTLVIKDRDGGWYADPFPNAGSGLLATGLNQEPPSEKDFSEADSGKK